MPVGAGCQPRPLETCLGLGLGLGLGCQWELVVDLDPLKLAIHDEQKLVKSVGAHMRGQDVGAKRCTRLVTVLRHDGEGR